MKVKNNGTLEEHQMSTKKTKKKLQGHYCKVCGEHKANEAFSGKGHASHICKVCAGLSPAERSARVIINKIDNMAYRNLSKEDIKWLRSKLNDPNLEIQQAARGVHGERFQEYEHSQAQKGLTVLSFDFFIHGSVWEWGDEIPVHMRFSLDNTGMLTRLDCTNDVETEIEVDRVEARKFLKSLIHEWHVLFWDEDLSDKVWSVDEEVDLLPEYKTNHYDDDLEDDEIEDDEASVTDEIPQADREPIWTVLLELNNGKLKELTFYNQMHTEPQELYLTLQAWFEEQEAMEELGDNSDDEDADD